MTPHTATPSLPHIPKNSQTNLLQHLAYMFSFFAPSFLPVISCPVSPFVHPLYSEDSSINQWMAKMERVGVGGEGGGAEIVWGGEAGRGRGMGYGGAAGSGVSEWKLSQENFFNIRRVISSDLTAGGGRRKACILILLLRYTFFFLAFLFCSSGNKDENTYRSMN